MELLEQINKFTDRRGPGDTKVVVTTYKHLHGGREVEMETVEDLCGHLKAATIAVNGEWKELWHEESGLAPKLDERVHKHIQKMARVKNLAVRLYEHDCVICKYMGVQP